MELLDVATSHALGEEAVGAIFDRLKGRVKWDKDAGEGASNRPGKKKNMQWHEGSLVAAFDRKGCRKPTEGTPNHFEKLLEGPCPNHSFPIEHLYKDYVLLSGSYPEAPTRGSTGRSLAR